MFFSVLSQAIPSSVYVFYAFFLVLIYFGVLTYIFSTKTNKVFKGIGNAFSIGAEKIKYLIIPCILIFIIFYLVGILNNFISTVQAIQLVPLLIFTAFLAWAMIYFISEVNKLE